MCNGALLASNVIDFAMLPTQSILVQKRFVYRCHVTSNRPMKVHGKIFYIVLVISTKLPAYATTISCVHLAWKWIHQLWTFVWGFLTPQTKENQDFFNWEMFHVSSYEQPIVSKFTLPVTRNLEIWCSTILSETPKKNEASATECWRTWTNHITWHRRSSLNGAGIID